MLLNAFDYVHFNRECNQLSTQHACGVGKPKHNMVKVFLNFLTTIATNLVASRSLLMMLILIAGFTPATGARGVMPYPGGENTLEFSKYLHELLKTFGGRAWTRACP